MITISLIILISLIFTSKSVSGSSSLFLLNLIPSRILQFWRLFTFTFVHSSWSHFFGNISLLLIGFLGFYQHFSNLEFFYFFIITSILSAIPFIVVNFSNSTKSLCGLSGFVFAVLYGFITINPLFNLNLYFFNCPIWIFGLIHFTLEIIGSINKRNVSLLSHISGAIVGSLYILIYLK